MKKLSLPLMAVAALGLAACGGKTLDTKNVEKDIQQIASSGDGAVETEAKCPDEVSDAKKGKTYECELTYAGNDNNVQKVEMKVSNDDAESDFVDQKAVQDEGLIRQLIAASDADPAVLCDRVSDEVLEELGGDECATAATESDDGKPANIKSVAVDGDTATVVSTEATVTLERAEDGSWTITAIE